MKKNIAIYSFSFCTLFTAVCLPLSSTHAQYVADYKRNADNYYAKGDWYSAAQYYEQYLQQQKKATGNTYEPYTIQGTGATKKSKATAKKQTSQQEVVYRIAESYRKIHDYNNAERWYAQSIGFDKTQYPYTSFYYGICLRANGKYQEAAQQFEQFLAAYSTKDIYQIQAKKELANCTFIQQQLAKKDLALYSVAKANINAAGATYALQSNGNQAVFSSTKTDTTQTKNPYKNNLYHAVKSDGVLAGATLLNIPGGKDIDQAAACFSPDGKRLYFTRFSKKNGLSQSAIYVATKNDTAWSAPVALNENINASGSNNKQPFISADGKYILFASDREGGVGKFDIWYAPLQNNEPGVARNMGNIINTNADEEAPFYHAASQTLVFASDGYMGMGGLDLFQAKGAISGSFATPTNLGYPVNSVKDDNYFSSTGEQLLQNAYISSDRGTGCCYEIYAVDKQYKKYLQGTITDCKTNTNLANASVQLVGTSTAQIKQTDATGQFLFELNNFDNFTLTASKSDYNNGVKNLPKPVYSNADTLYNIIVCLAPIEKVIPVDSSVVNTTPETAPQEKEQIALFNFAKYDLKPETQQLLDTLAGILQREKSLGLQIIGYTDAVGTTAYNQALSLQRANACKAYLVAKGVAANKLNVQGKGECCPVQPDTIGGQDNPAGRKANRRVEFKIFLIQ